MIDLLVSSAAQYLRFLPLRFQFIRDARPLINFLDAWNNILNNKSLCEFQVPPEIGSGITKPIVQCNFASQCEYGNEVLVNVFSSSSTKY